MKRTVPSDNDSFVQFRQMECSGYNSKSAFQKVCKYFYGRYAGNKLLSFEVAPPEARGPLKNLIRNTFKYGGSVTDIAAIPNGAHKAFDVMNNIKDYNVAFYFTQRVNFTFDMDVSSVKEFVERRYDEKELIHLITADDRCPFLNTVLPLYDMGRVTGIVYGAYVVQTILSYFNANDRAVVDMGPKEKCYSLLNSLGSDVVFIDKHPPLPTAKRYYEKRQSFCLSSFYQDPVPSFEMIRFIDQSNEYDPDDMVECGTRRIKHITSIPDDMVAKDTCFVYIDALPPTKGPPLKKASTVTIMDVDKISKSKSRQWVIVFRNNTSLKAYNTLKHALDDRVTRTTSLLMFIDETARPISDRSFCTYVAPFLN
jgi:hypothetical protein